MILASCSPSAAWVAASASSCVRGSGQNDDVGQADGGWLMASPDTGCIPSTSPAMQSRRYARIRLRASPAGDPAALQHEVMGAGFALPVKLGAGREHAGRAPYGRDRISNSSVCQGAQMPVKRVGQPAQQFANAVDPAGLFMEFDATVFGNLTDVCSPAWRHANEIGRAPVNNFDQYRLPCSVLRDFPDQRTGTKGATWA